MSACGLKAFAPATLQGGAIDALRKKAPVVSAGGLQLHVLPDARDGFFLQAIHNAKTVVRVEVYLLTHPGVMDELIAAKARGVDVQVMLEQNPFNPGNPDNPLPTNRVAAKKLLAGGIQAAWTNPVYKYTHAKLMVVDDTVAFVSTANFTKSGLGVNGDGSREYIFEDRVPADVAQFIAVFKADWARQPFQPTDAAVVASPVNARGQIFALIKSAHKEVTIQVEVAGDPALDELIASKCREGVKVRALLADLPALKPHNAAEAERSNGDVAAAWAKAGAEVRYQGAPHLHAKAVVVDGRAMYVGSVNMTTNSMDNNRELGLIVTAPALVQVVHATFDKDFAGGTPSAKRRLVAPKTGRKDDLDLPTDLDLAELF